MNYSAAIVCVWGGTQRTTCGIIRLDPKTFAYRAFQSYELSTGEADKFQTSFSRREQVFAICDNTVYISFLDYGIVIFPEKGEPRLLCEENGLPSTKIYSLDIMNGRIYAVTRENDQTGLIEIEPNTMQTRILISPRVREDSHPLDGGTTTNVIADRRFNRLWVSYRSRTAYSCYFDPNTLTATPVPSNPDFLGDRFDKFRRQGRFLYVTTSIYLYIIDFSTDNIALAANHNPSLSTARKQTLWKADLQLNMFAGNNKTLISTAKDDVGDNFVVMFNAGESEPKKLTGDSFPSVNSIRDFGCTDKGMLILTDSTLYLMPHKEENTN